MAHKFWSTTTKTLFLTLRHTLPTRGKAFRLESTSSSHKTPSLGHHVMDLRCDDNEDAKMLSKLINALGGPIYATEDLAWASSMPQGKLLLEWLSSQVPHGELALKRPQADGDVIYQAALQSIALHDQELLESVSDLLSDDCHSSSLVPTKAPDSLIDSTRIRQRGDQMGLEHPRDTKDPSPSGVSNSCNPLRIYSIILNLTSAKSRLSEEEAELLEKETRLLRYRLSRSKWVHDCGHQALQLIISPRVAARELAQTIKTLQSEIETVGKEVRLQDAKLSELGINVRLRCLARTFLLTMVLYRRTTLSLGLRGPPRDCCTFRRQVVVDMRLSHCIICS